MQESHKTGAQGSAIALEPYSRCVRLVAKPKLGKIEDNKPMRCIFRGSATDAGMKSATDSDLIPAIPI
jgi:hypothetical protein